MALVLFVVGVALLVVGAEALVRGASRLAAAVGLSPLVIGLTVVAFGTSAPELAVSLQAAFAGRSDLVLGNVVGSNIANVLLILGISSTVAPLIVARQLVHIEVPIMVGVSFAFLLVALDGQVSRLDGLALVAATIAYTAFTVWRSRAEGEAAPAATAITGAVRSAPVVEQHGAGEGASGARVSDAHSPAGLFRVVVIQIVFVVAGVALLVLGARWLVAGAVEFARWLGLSELVIGLTIVAVGTSLPEIAASLMAALRGERDIAAGNVIGSCIFNILLVLGLTSALAPVGLVVPQAILTFDIPVMIVVAISCLPIFFTGHIIARWEGALFLAYYGAYTLYLWLNATEHDALPAFSVTMLLFVLPLTAVTLVVLGVREAHARHEPRRLGRRPSRRQETPA